MVDDSSEAGTAVLETPLLLLAMPQVVDPFFHKSVVLLIHHQEEGSFGFIVNRPTGIKVKEVLAGLEIVWNGDAEQLAYFGGPVQPQVGTVLFASGDVEGAADVAPGIAMTQHIEELQSLAAEPPSAMRLLLGYAGWGDGQLVREILRNDWVTAPVRAELVFGGDPVTAWREAFASVGIDPATLPTLTHDGDEPAN